MAPVQLRPRPVRKIWGRHDIPASFGVVGNSCQPLGEIWFEGPDEAAEALLIKYLFTSERLSIQVHPDDAAARLAGYRSGKDEAWIVVAAEPDARIGVGLTRPVSKSSLRRAALDGSIETLLDWRPVNAGDFLYSPAGTIHSLGEGLTLIEVQQNVDLTYRLYDFGRPRELHLDEAVEAAAPRPLRPKGKPRGLAFGREALFQGPKFVLERWRGGRGLLADASHPVWLIPVAGAATAEAQELEPGSVYLLREPTEVAVAPGSELFLAYAGAQVRFLQDGVAQRRAA